MLLPGQFETGDVRIRSIDRLRLRKAVVDAANHLRLDPSIDRILQGLVERPGLYHAKRFEEMLEKNVKVVGPGRSQVRIADVDGLFLVALDDERRQVAEIRTGDAHAVGEPKVRILVESKPVLHARQRVRVVMRTGHRARRHVVPL